MNSVTYIRRSLLQRPFAKALQVLVLALGMASLGLLLSLSKATDKLLLNDVQNIDLVVGAKGSPLQLILSAALHLDMPTGNIPVADAEKLKRHPLVKLAVPVALGDNLNGYRIVGTSLDYPALYHADLAEGVFWAKEMQATLGAEVAAKLHLKMGDRFAGSHGLVKGGEQHKTFPYTVVGILKPTGTVIDRLVLTGVNSVWYIHANHQEDDGDDEDDAMHHASPEYTAMLLQYKTPLAAATLPREINKGTLMQAAAPAMEMARLYNYFGHATDVVRGFGWLLVIIAFLSIFAALLQAAEERKTELALMRVLGARPLHLAMLMLADAVITSLAAILLGIVITQIAACWVMGQFMPSDVNTSLSLFDGQHMLLYGITLVLALISAAIPAMKAYRTSILGTLTR